MSEKIYLAFDASGLFKIGITQDIKKRYRTFKTSNPTIKILFCFSVENAAVTELELHTKFWDKRVAGEWFALDPMDLKYFYDKFMGEHARHSEVDFEALHMAVSINKRAGDWNWQHMMAEFEKENGIQY